MKAILILGAVLLALGALLRLVRLGALAEYSAAGLRLKLKVGPLRLMLYPRKPKQPRRKAGKSSRREKKREERPQPELGGGPLALVKRFLPLIAEAAGRFRRKLRIVAAMPTTRNTLPPFNPPTISSRRDALARSAESSQLL